MDGLWADGMEAPTKLTAVSYVQFSAQLRSSTTDTSFFPFPYVWFSTGNRYRHIVDLRAAHYRIRLL
jgi:hypothetical protein